jgi:hypothetical protein
MKTAFNILFFIVPLWVAAQRPTIILDVEPKDALPGDVLTITVKANIQGNIQVDYPPGFTHGYNIMNGMEQEVDYNTGKIITFFYMSQSGAISKPGTYKFGPAQIKRAGRVYKSNTVTVNIRKENQSNGNGDQLSARQLKQPAFGIIEKSKSSIYEGEPVVLNAKIFARFNPTHLEDYQSYVPSGIIDKHDLPGSSRIMVDEERMRKTTFYTFEYDKKVIFPSGSGKVTIQPFKLILRRSMDALPISSTPTTIEVKALPKGAPTTFIGGVGQFSISGKFDKTSSKQGDVVKYTLTITGNGNLHNIEAPKLTLPNSMILYGDPVVKEDVSFGVHGAEGNITYEYNIQLIGHGNLVFPQIRLAYFNPELEKYIELSEPSVSLSVEKNPSFKYNPSLVQEKRKGHTTPDLYPIREQITSQSKTDDFFMSTWFWTGVGSPLVFAFLLGIWFRRDEEKERAEEKSLMDFERKNAIQTLLSQTEQALAQGQHTLFYELLEKTISEAILQCSEKNIDQRISVGLLIDELGEKHPKYDDLKRLYQIMQICQEARYGMGGNGNEPQQMLASSKNIMNQILS